MYYMMRPEMIQNFPNFDQKSLHIHNSLYPLPGIGNEAKAQTPQEDDHTQECREY